MRTIGQVAWGMAAGLLLAGCGGGGASGDGAGSGAPAATAAAAPAVVASTEAAARKAVDSELSKSQQKRLDEALAKARSGQAPTHDCTMLAGVIAGTAKHRTPKPAEVRAFETCYVDATVEYIRARLAKAGDDTGREEACVGAVGHLTALSMSLGGAAADVGLDRADLDSRIIERVAAVGGDHCTAVAAALGR